MQSSSPFLLYRNHKSAISGFWFYCKEDCERICDVLEKLTKKSSIPNNSESQVIIEESKVHHHPQQQQQHQQNGTNIQNKQDVDIFSMLSKAQAEFTNCGVTTAGNSVEQKFTEMNINKAQQVPQHQPLMKQMSNVMPDITSPNVVSFFAAAQQPTNGIIPVIDSKQVGPQFLRTSDCIPITQPPMTVDQLEKQHRMTSKSPRAGKYPLTYFFRFLIC